VRYEFNRFVSGENNIIETEYILYSENSHEHSLYYIQSNDLSLHFETTEERRNKKIEEILEK